MKKNFNPVLTIALAVLMTVGVFFPGAQAEAATAEELQKMVAELQAKIARIQGRDEVKSDVRPEQVATLPAGTPGGDFPKVGVIKQLTRELKAGETTTVAAVTLRPTKKDRNLNEVILHVSSGKSVANPWDTFTDLGIVINGMQVKNVDVDSPEQWKEVATKNGVKVYAVRVYRGNAKLVAGKSYTAKLTATLSDEADDNVNWSVWIPKDGLTVWASESKHVKFGPSKRFGFKVVDGTQSDDDTEEEGEESDTVASTTAEYDLTLYSPVAGTVLKTGSKVNLEWKNIGLDKEKILVYLEGNNTQRKLGNGPMNVKRGYGKVTIPREDKIGLVTSGDYEICITVTNLKDGDPKNQESCSKVVIEAAGKDVSTPTSTTTVEGTVLGASTTIYDEIAVTLSNINELLGQL